MTSRIEALRNSLSQNNLDGYLATNESNILYLTNAVGAAELWVPIEGQSTVYVSGTNYESVKAAAEDCTVEMLKGTDGLFKKMAEKTKVRTLKVVGFDSLDVVRYMALRRALRGTKLKPFDRLVQELRMVKDPTELESIKKAAEFTDAGVEAALNVLVPGVREYEVAGEIEYAMRKLGSEGTAFDTIVASGLTSAYPHGGCTDQKIREREFIVLDLGARYKNYRADLTRTFMIGKPTPRQRKIYEVVKEAQQKAFESIKPGVQAKEVDNAARKVIEKEGFGKYFVHGLGHGVGLDVHEAPWLRPESKDQLKVGNVVTDEPGIYVVGYGGARIEDTILVQKNKAERLTKAPYELTVE